jgi:hypothetical protein
MLDTFLSAAAGILPTLLSVAGVLVSLKAPHSRYHRLLRFGLLGVGVSISAITFWQQSRARTAHVAELTAQTHQIAELKTTVSGQNSEINGLRNVVDVLNSRSAQESARREQAEHDLLVTVRGTGEATRAGVAADLRKAPIKLAINGPTGTPVDQTKMNALAELIAAGNVVQQRAPKAGAPAESIQPWIDSAQAWWSRVDRLISENCGAQALVTARDLTGMLAMSYATVSSDARAQSTYQNVDRLISNLVQIMKRPELCP